MSLYESAVSGSPPDVPYQRIARQLRHDIEEGKFESGGQLPTQAALVRRFEVSRATVQRALEELRRDGWIDSQQGRGSYVLDRPGIHASPEPAGVGLADHVDAAFRAADVTLDSFSLTAETLNSALQGPLHRVRTGELRPVSITVRLLLPSPEAVLALPRSVSDSGDDRPLRRLRKLTISQAVTLQSAVGALADSGHVPDVTVDIRTVDVTPLHKLYLLNGTDALFGYYEVVKRSVAFDGHETEMYDVLGLDAALFHHSVAADNGRSAAFVRRSQRWFESLWSTIAKPLTLFE